MKFLYVISLSLFISVKSSTARAQDGIFQENAKTINGKNLHLAYLAHNTPLLKDQSCHTLICCIRNACSGTKQNKMVVKIQVKFSSS